MKLLRNISLILDRFTDRVCSWFLTIGKVALAIMTIAIVYQVFMRYVFRLAPAWSEELARSLMVWMTFLLAPYLYKHNLFVNLDIILDKLSGFWVNIIRFTHIILEMVVIVVLLFLSWKFMLNGLYSVSASLGIKMIYIFTVLPIGCGMLLLVGIEKIIDYIIFFSTGEAVGTQKLLHLSYETAQSSSEEGAK